MRLNIVKTIVLRWKERRRVRSCSRIPKLLAKLERKVNAMANKVEEYLDRQITHNEHVTKSIEEIVEDVKNQQTEIQELKDAIANANTTPEIEAKIAKLDEHNDSIKTKLDALNALVPPKPPVV